MKRLTYIEGTGTQYIDSGVPGNTADIKVVLSYKPTSGYTSEHPVLCSAWSANAIFLMLYSNKWRYHSGGTSIDVSSLDTSNPSILICEYNKFTLNGTEYTLSASGTNSSNNIQILGKGGYQYGNIGRGQIYGCKFYSGSTLLKSLVPAIDDNDVVCLYDEVSKTFLYNAGSGDFVKGAIFLEDLIDEQQLDFNNWTKVAGAISFNNVYDSSDNVNTLIYRGADGYEHYYTPVIVAPNTDYVWHLQFCSPSGFSCGYGQSDEYIGVSANAPTTTQAFPVSDFLAHTTALNKSASSTMQDYTVTFNSGNRSTIYLVVDTGYMIDGVTVTLKYKFGESAPASTKKYLLKSGNDYYTISGGTLTNIGSTLNAQLFEDYGLDAIPYWSDYSSLQNPSVLCWDAEEIVDMLATTTGLPTAQAFVSEGISLVVQGTDGIDNIDITDTGAPKWAFSVDAGNTWKVWSGSAWVTSSGADMTSAEVETLTDTEWDALTSGASAMKVRFTLTASSDGVSKIEVFYKQA